MRHKKRAVKQTRKELFECRRRVNKLVFGKKGDYNKSIDRRDKRFASRAFFIIGGIMRDNAEGTYESTKGVKRGRE